MSIDDNGSKGMNKLGIDIKYGDVTF